MAIKQREDATLNKKGFTMLHEFLDGNAHFIEIKRDLPEGGFETLVYALIPVDLLSQKEIMRVMEIRQMNYPDKRP